MQARILNQSEEHLWADFVEKHQLGNIHQAPEWGHFRSKVNGSDKYWIIVAREEFTPGSQTLSILAGTLIVRHSLPHGYCWLYAPRGPLLDYDSPEKARSQMDALMIEIKKIAKQEKAVFLRIDPSIITHPEAHSQTGDVSMSPSRICTPIVHTTSPSTDASPALSHLSSDFPPRGGHDLNTSIDNSGSAFRFPHFRQNIHGFQPDHTLILDLALPEQDILAQMKPKGRYNIKLAEKKGVTIRKVVWIHPHHLPSFQATATPSQSETADLAAFYRILSETTSRDAFHGHDQKFYENMLSSLGPRAALYLAEYEGRTIAGAINTFYKDTATYYYGASSNEHRNVMAPYLLHWRAICDAKSAGFTSYDFFGIAPENAPHHPWAGVTEFKKKFGGSEVSYQLPQEFVFKKALYLLYRTYKNWRR